MESMFKLSAVMHRITAPVIGSFRRHKDAPVDALPVSTEADATDATDAAPPAPTPHIINSKYPLGVTGFNFGDR